MGQAGRAYAAGGVGRAALAERGGIARIWAVVQAGRSGLICGAGRPSCGYARGISERAAEQGPQLDIFRAQDWLWNSREVSGAGVSADFPEALPIRADLVFAFCSGADAGGAGDAGPTGVHAPVSGAADGVDD